VFATLFLFIASLASKSGFTALASRHPHQTPPINVLQVTPIYCPQRTSLGLHAWPNQADIFMC
jgi:hypothetical protein